MNILQQAKKYLNQVLIKQYANPAPNNKYACFFTVWLMYFRHKYKMKMDFMQYREACLKLGAIDERFFIKSHNLMCVAAGFPKLNIRSTSQNMKEKICELLLKESPVPFSLDGRHFESVDGYEYDKAHDELIFLVDDPGYQGDTHCDAKTLEVFRLVNGERKYSTHPSGQRRKITKVYWTE